MDYITYVVTLFSYWVIYTIPASILIVPIEHFKEVKPVMVAVLVVCLAYYYLAFVFAREAARIRLGKGESYFKSMHLGRQVATSELMARGSFLPVVGPFFQARIKSKDE